MENFIIGSAAGIAALFLLMAIVVLLLKASGKIAWSDLASPLPKSLRLFHALTLGLLASAAVLVLIERPASVSNIIVFQSAAALLVVVSSVANTGYRVCRKMGVRLRALVLQR